VVKIWATGNTATTSAHLCYLSQEGKGVDWSRTVLFTSAGAGADRRGLTERSHGDLHQFRMIVSLVDGAFLDLLAFVRAYMRQIEQDVGARLDWMVANHRDTGHIHTHVVIRGRDPQGDLMYFTKHYWSHGLRYRAQELAADVPGPLRTAQVRELDRRRMHALSAWVAEHARDAGRCRTQGDGMAR
jgi:type IV secretory pathway VirD2 relaxase